MIKLYLDEDVPEAVAKALRLRGYDVVTVKGDKQCNMAECSDEGISIERFEDDD